jgi:mycothiol synthase
VADVAIRPGSADDVRAAYEVLAACDHGTWFEFDVDALRELWPFYRATWMAEQDGVVAYAAVRGNEIEVYVLPSARRRGIGSRLLDLAEAALDAPVVESTARRDESAAAPFFAVHGYEPVYETWLMQIETVQGLAPPTWPEGIRVRTFRADDARAVKELLDAAYADDQRYRPPAFDHWKRFMMDSADFDPACWFLAEAPDGSLAGASLSWKQGFIKDLVVDPAWQRRGLGEALMRHTFCEFRRRGARRVTLKTDSLNPSRAWRLYERVGMHIAETYDAFEKRV